MNNQKLIQKIYAQINKNIFKQKWECLSDGCSQEAINSHLLQRNGILNTITKNGHLIEVKTEDVFKWEKTEFPLAFNKIGLKNSMAHPLFCDQHDTHIFYNIEKAQIDFYVINHNYFSHLEQFVVKYAKNKEMNYCTQNFLTPIK
jgi:hypothetical protein